MSYEFKFPTHVFWGFKPWMLPETQRFGAKSPSCDRAYAIFTHLGVKGTGIQRLQGLIFFLLSVSMQGKHIWNKGSIHVHTPSLLWNSLVVYVNYFAFVSQKWCLESDAGKTRRGQRSKISLKVQILVVETKKHQETGKPLFPYQGIFLLSCRQSKELNLGRRLEGCVCSAVPWKLPHAELASSVLF